jgi:diguanylate cyclase (GGDEF)-like protein
MPNTPAQEGFTLAERVRKKIATCHFMHKELDITLSISSGVSSSRYFDQYDELIKAVDTSLYRAKKKGRNRTEPQLFLNSALE